jgi:hypothetical protein
MKSTAILQAKIKEGGQGRFTPSAKLIWHRQQLDLTNESYAVFLLSQVAAIPPAAIPPAAIPTAHLKRSICREQNKQPQSSPSRHAELGRKG